jgi:hypothetical protein
MVAEKTLSLHFIPVLWLHALQVKSFLKLIIETSFPGFAKLKVQYGRERACDQDRDLDNVKQCDGQILHVKKFLGAIDVGRSKYPSSRVSHCHRVPLRENFDLQPQRGGRRLLAVTQIKLGLQLQHLSTAVVSSLALPWRNGICRSNNMQSLSLHQPTHPTSAL